MRKLLTFRRRFKFGNPGGPDDRCTSWGPAKRFIDALPGVVRNGGAVDGGSANGPCRAVGLRPQTWGVSRLMHDDQR
jgi:hypothetical protein